MRSKERVPVTHMSKYQHRYQYRYRYVPHYSLLIYLKNIFILLRNELNCVYVEHFNTQREL
jgi:hypothetical protein